MPGEPDERIINICRCFHIVIKYICDSSWIHREVSEKDAKDYADSIHAIFVETSAKNAININEVFIEISESVSPTRGAFDLLHLVSAAPLSTSELDVFGRISVHERGGEKNTLTALFKTWQFESCVPSVTNFFSRP